MTTHLTPDAVIDYMGRVEQARKMSPFQWCKPTVDEHGRGQVTIRTSADTPAIAKWFRDVGLVVTQFSFNVATGERIAYFRVMDVEGQS